MASELYVKGTASGAKAQNVEWFAADLVPGLRDSKAADFIIELELATTVQAAGNLEYTDDSGSTWFKLGGDGAGAITTTLRFRVLIAEGGLFNIRSINAAGATVDRCIVVADLDA